MLELSDIASAAKKLARLCSVSTKAGLPRLLLRGMPADFLRVERLTIFYRASVRKSNYNEHRRR